MLKVKKFYTYDLPIVDLEEGQGKLKNMLGAFLVKFKNNIVKVGTGISEKQRKEFWSNKEDLIGKIIEVKDGRTRYFDYDEETYYICSNCHEPILKDEPFEKIDNMYFHKKDCE